jgi:putative DNA primase/helicase
MGDNHDVNDTLRENGEGAVRDDLADAENFKGRRKTRNKPGKTNGNPLPPKTLPTITIKAGELHRATDAAVAALAEAGAPFYQRDLKLVYVARKALKLSDGKLGYVPAVIELDTATVKRILAHTVVWQRFNKKGACLTIDPPHGVIEQMLYGMLGEWPFPPLRGVISTPTMRHDGTLLLAPGYDKETGLVLFEPPPMPPLADRPSRKDTAASLELLNDLIAEFNFAADDGVSRSAALSMLMTPVLRGAMPVAPMHVITKPVAGTGASYLQDLAASIAFGERCPVIAFSDKDDENDKRLMDATINQQPIIAIDNVTSLLMSGYLCQLVERPVLQPRKLGAGLVTTANSFCVFANGNNLVIGGNDTVRRTIAISLDANMENPEIREFTRDPVADVMADRGKYIGAILTIARAYCVANKPGRLKPLASFNTWSDLVRSALVWLGEADPVESMQRLRDEDPVVASLVNLFTAWVTELTIGAGYKTGDLIAVATETDGNGVPIRPTLREALRAIAGTKTAEIDPRCLGDWLRGHKNRIASGYKLTVDTSDKKRPKWTVTRP